MDLVLIVEKDPGFLDQLKERYQQRYRLLSARSFIEGARLIQEHSSIAAVVVGIALPIEDTIGFLQRISQANRHAAIVILCDGRLIETIRYQMDKGSHALFLARPCPLADIDRALATGLTRYRKRHPQMRVQDGPSSAI